jgi:glutathione synthase/RimK-type ligase-like ATP-grasp enzyme
LSDFDEDWPSLRAALARAGAEAVFAAWDDPGVDWEGFDSVVIRSTWNYSFRPDDFLAWARHVAQVTALWNPMDVVTWNIDKTYLRELEAEGVPVIVTTWVGPSDGWEPPAGEFVVKPSISAGGVETARYGPGDEDEAARHVRRLQDARRTVMVQPYAEAVDEEGELAVVFIEGKFSHAVRKRALLRRGDGVQGRPAYCEDLEAATATRRQRDAAEQVSAGLRGRFGRDPLYCRVDLVSDSAGWPLVLEVELIEPSLFLVLAPGSAERLAAALCR